MFKKIIISTVVAVSLSITCASANTALAKVASSQENLAHMVQKAYRSKNKTALSDTIRKLEAGHAKLASNIHDRELKNLLVYLNLCLKDLEKISKSPYSRQNAKRVADLSSSLREGNHYILSSL